VTAAGSVHSKTVDESQEGSFDRRADADAHAALLNAVRMKTRSAER
jgi:hypothetical protein